MEEMNEEQRTLMSEARPPKHPDPQRVMAWLKVIAYAAGLLLTTGSLVAGIAYGKYEMDRNTDLTRQLSAWDKKQSIWDKKWSASQEQIQSLQQQLLEARQQNMSHKSEAAGSELLQKSYENCQTSLSKLKKTNNEGILNYISNLNQEMISVENAMYRIQGKNTDEPASPNDALYLEDYKTEQAALQKRIVDAQKRLICPG